MLRQQRQRDALVQKYQDKQGKLSTTTTTLSNEKIDQKANAPPLIDSLYKKPDNGKIIDDLWICGLTLAAFSDMRY